MYLKSICVFAGILCSGYQAVGQNTIATAPPKRISYSVGAGMAFMPQYEGSSDVFILPTAGFSARWTTGQYIRLAGLNLESNVLKQNAWEIGPKLQFKTPRNKDIVDNIQVNALADIDFSVSGGLFARYKFGNRFDVKAEYTHDVSGVYDGGMAMVELGYTQRKGKALIRMTAFTSVATEGYMDTYFGITPETIGTSTLPYYDLDGGFKDIGCRINTTYILSKHWSVTGQVGYTQLLGDVADSPVVKQGNASQFSGGLVAMYRF